MRLINRHERKVLRTARAISLAFALAYLCLLVALLVGKPKAAGILITPLIGFVADGSVMLDASGNVVLNDDGTVRLASGTSDGCNCTCCAACGGCDPGPCSATIVMTAWTACTCQNDGVNSELATGNLNGTWDLTRPGAVCQFVSGDTGVRADAYSGTTCTTLTVADPGPHNLTLTRTSSTNWSVVCATNFFSSPTNTVPANDCTTSFTAANVLACAFGRYGTGGSAAVTLHY